MWQNIIIAVQARETSTERWLLCPICAMRMHLSIRVR